MWTIVTALVSLLPGTRDVATPDSESNLVRYTVLTSPNNQVYLVDDINDINDING